MTSSIVIIDDHPMIRHGLKSVISKHGSCTVSGEASNGKSGLALIDQAKPDVVILDITLQGSDGISLVSKIKELGADIKIIMYSMHSSKEYIGRSFTCGAIAYVLKNDKIEEMITAIESVLQDKIYLSSSIPQTILTELITSKKNTENVIDTLTSREFEIASLISRGNTPNQIADLLFISPKTVRVHRTNIMHKLSCSHVHELLLQLRKYFPQ